MGRREYLFISTGVMVGILAIYSLCPVGSIWRAIIIFSWLFINEMKGVFVYFAGVMFGIELK